MQNPFTWLGVATLGLVIPGLYSLRNTSVSMGLHHHRRALDNSTNSTDAPYLNSTDFDPASPTPYQNISIPLDISAFLRSVRGIEEDTDTYDVVMGFRDTDCEGQVLQQLFSEQEGAAGENVTDIAANATSWQSNITSFNQRQMQLNQIQFERAIGVALTDGGECLSNIALENANPTNETVTTPASSFLENTGECAEVPGAEALEGFNALGARVFEANLYACKPAASEEHHRHRREASANNPNPLQEKSGELTKLIEEIRRNFCPQNTSIIASNTTEAVTIVDHLRQEISRLCPSTSVSSMSLDTLSTSFLSFSWMRTLYAFAQNATNQTLFLLDTTQAAGSTDLSSLTRILDYLISLGVAIVSASPHSPLNRLPQVRTDLSVGQALVRHSRSVRNAESQGDQTLSPVAIVVAPCLVLLVGGMVYARKRSRQVPNQTASSSESTEEAEMLLLTPDDNQVNPETPSSRRDSSDIPFIDDDTASLLRFTDTEVRSTGYFPRRITRMHLNEPPVPLEPEGATGFTANVAIPPDIDTSSITSPRRAPQQEISSDIPFIDDERVSLLRFTDSEVRGSGLFPRSITRAHLNEPVDFSTTEALAHSSTAASSSLQKDESVKKKTHTKHTHAMSKKATKHKKQKDTSSTKQTQSPPQSTLSFPRRERAPLEPRDPRILYFTDSEEDEAS